jgi:YggT family protein
VVTFLVNFIELLCNVLTIAIIFRVILSWFSPRPTNRLAIVLIQITEPFLRPLRRIVPRAGVFDFTPLVAIVILMLISYLLGYLLF